MSELTTRPTISLLTDTIVERIIDEAYTILDRTGVQVESEDARRLLAAHGVRIEHDRAHFPAAVIDGCRQSVPRSIPLYDRDGNLTGILMDNRIHFDPGSAALNLLDSDGRTIRKPVTRDLVRFARLVERLDNFAFQSTALIASDVPTEIADRYRLFLVLQNCRKPVVTGTFQADAFEVMHRMLSLVRGGEDQLRQKPLAIFDCCPSSPLKWSRLTVSDLMKAARAGIPAELVSMPLSGAAAPVTLLGSLVQHTAENLSGIVIHQLAQPGAPIIYGGSPAIMDMKKGTTPMGAIETMMVDVAYARIGKYLGFPTHAYMGLSDSKTVDTQAGFETGMGALMAALGGVNVISGGGMLDFESCQSLEKLVIDNDVAGMSLRLARGITVRDEPYAREFFEEGFDGNFLASPRTFDLFQEEFFMPSDAVDRSTSQEWESHGKMTSLDRARILVDKLLGQQPNLLDESRCQGLREIMEVEFKRCGARIPA